MRLAAALLLSGFLALPALAHEGHEEAPGTEAQAGAATVTLSDAAIENLGIATEAAELRETSDTITVNAAIEYLPERRAQLSPKIDGKVRDLRVKLGEAVKQGAPLVILDPIFVGSPPVTLAAPIDGYVTQQQVVLGQAVTKDSTLLEVADLSQVLVSGKVFEDQKLQAIKPGQKVRLTTPAYPGETFAGAVQRIDTTLEPGTRTLGVYALVDNPSRKLLSNMQAQMTLELGAPRQALLIPAKAVLGETGEYFVFVREGNAFERRPVTLGKKYGATVEVIEGVLPDDRVVTVGNYQLQFAKPSAKPAETPH